MQSVYVYVRLYSRQPRMLGRSEKSEKNSEINVRITVTHNGEVALRACREPSCRRLVPRKAYEPRKARTVKLSKPHRDACVFICVFSCVFTVAVHLPSDMRSDAQHRCEASSCASVSLE